MGVASLTLSAAVVALFVCAATLAAPAAAPADAASTSAQKAPSSASASAGTAVVPPSDKTDNAGATPRSSAKPRSRAKASSSTKQLASPLAEIAAEQPLTMSRAGLSFAPNAPGAKGIKAFPMPLDTKLVVFPFDPNYTYPLFARNGLFTRIKLGPGEKVVGFYMSNQLRWIHHVAKNRGSIYVMPLDDGLFNTATLETNQRDYELTFTSVPEPENWYQRVSWHFPTSNFEEDEQPDPHAADADVDELVEATKAARLEQPASAGSVARKVPAAAVEAGTAELVDLAKAHFTYAVEGDAPFKPSLVFDDGRATWLRMPTGQEAPAFFILTKDGLGQPVTPVPHGQYVVISQLMPYGALLKLGKDEVRIRNKDADCGLFGRNCWSGAGARNVKD